MFDVGKVAVTHSGMTIVRDGICIHEWPRAWVGLFNDERQPAFALFCYKPGDDGKSHRRFVILVSEGIVSGKAHLTVDTFFKLLGVINPPTETEDIAAYVRSRFPGRFSGRIITQAHLMIDTSETLIDTNAIAVN